MDIQISDVLYMKKNHPCGNHCWDTLRVGMHFKLRCQGCGHELTLPRRKVEQSLKQILRNGQVVPTKKEENQ